MEIAIKNKILEKAFEETSKEIERHYFDTREEFEDWKGDVLGDFVYTLIDKLNIQIEM